MANGVKFGRPRKLDPHQRREALKRIAKGETYTAIARTCARRKGRNHDDPQLAGRAGEQIRVGHQLGNSHDARPRSPADAARPRRRGD